MATFDVAAANAMLKTVFQDPLFDGVVTHSRVIDLFEQNANVKEGPQGRYIEGAQMFGYNEGIGARDPANGFLPVPGNPTFVNFRVFLKTNYAVAQMNRHVMANAVKSKAAFADWAEVELTKTERGLRADLDRQAIGYGAGILCRIDDASPDITLDIDAPYGLASDTKGWLPGLRRGMKIVAGPNADGTGLRSGGQSRTILSVSKSGNSGGGTLTLDADPLALGWAENDFLFRGDDLGNNAPVSGVEVEMMGLLGMVDDGTILDTLQNISRTSYDEWKAQVVDGSAAPYSTLASEALFMRMADDADELGNGTVTHFLMSKAVFRNAFVQIQKQLGYGANTTGPNRGVGGTKGLTILLGDRSVELRSFAKMPLGRIFGLDRSVLWRYHLSGFEWDDTTGTIFKQVGIGQGIKDAWYAYGRTEMELGITEPEKCVVATGLSEAIG